MPTVLFYPRVRPINPDAPVLGDPLHHRQAASIALNPALEAVICYNDAPLTREELGRVGLTLRQAWDYSAQCLIDHHLTLDFHPFCLSEDKGSWWEVHARGTRASDWLAHPQAFQVMNTAVEEEHGHDVAYLPRPRWESMLICVKPPVVSADLYTYRYGFPVPMRVRKKPSRIASAPL